MISEAKVQQLLQGQSGIARKVYDAVPISEKWTANQIRQAIKHFHVEQRTMMGCLKDLRESGLITETADGLFQRAPTREVKKKQQTLSQSKEVAAMAAVAKSTESASESKVEPMEMLSELSMELVAFGVEFQGRLKAFAIKIEDAALRIEQEREQQEENLGKLKQLQSLLKSLA